MNIIAIIPARGGSKGVPGKNIRQFAGKPLIVHSIEYALNTPGIDAVYVSTDDENIAEISQNADAEIIRRPAEISGDSATTESAIEHALSVIGLSPDIVVLLQPTSPLRPHNGLQAALEKFIKGNYDSLLSVSPSHRFFWKCSGEIAVPEYDFMNRPRRQDVKPEEMHYVENGSLYIFTLKNFVNHKNRLGGKIGFVIFPEEYSMEIDSESDFIMLETIHDRIEKDRI